MKTANLLGGIILMLSSWVYAEADFKIFSKPNELQQFRCHMGTCFYNKSISTKIIGKSRSHIILKVKVLTGESPPPSTKNIQKIQWYKKPDTLTIICSKEQPTVIYDSLIESLDLHPDIPIIGANENTVATYFKYCHSSKDFFNGAKRFHYRVNNSNTVLLPD